MVILKIALAPALIAAATLLGRRFGQSFAGWLVGFPFTSAPVALFLALEQGTSFAARAAVGSLSATAAEVAFGLAYMWTCGRGAVPAIAAATAAFAVLGTAMRVLDPTAAVAAVIAAIVLVIGQRLRPARRVATVVPAAVPRWDLPTRAVVAAVLVGGLTTVAPLLGAELTGLVSGFPVYAMILAVFAQRAGGPESARDVMRGLLAGLFGFASFFVVLSFALVPLGIAPAFALAIVAVLAVQSASLLTLRRS